MLVSGEFGLDAPSHAALSGDGTADAQAADAVGTRSFIEPAFMHGIVGFAIHSDVAGSSWKGVRVLDLGMPADRFTERVSGDH